MDTIFKPIEVEPEEPSEPTVNYTQGSYLDDYSEEYLTTRISANLYDLRIPPKSVAKIKANDGYVLLAQNGIKTKAINDSGILINDAKISWFPKTVWTKEILLTNDWTTSGAKITNDTECKFVIKSINNSVLSVSDNPFVTIEIADVGYNIPEYEEGYINDTGAIVSTAADVYLPEYIPVESGTTIKVSSNCEFSNYRIAIYDENNNFIRRVSKSGLILESESIAIGENEKFIRFSCEKTENIDYILATLKVVYV